jgi:hypothetical protein
MARAPAITPEHQSVVGALTFGRVGTPPQSVADRPVVMRRTPPAAPGTVTTRLAPTRTPEYRPQPPVDDDEQNVFKRRDREIGQEQQAEQRQQQRAQLPRFQPQQQDLQRLQEQQRNQEAQRLVPQQSAPQQRPPTATPRSTPRPEFRRIPEQSSPPTPNSAR